MSDSITIWNPPDSNYTDWYVAEYWTDGVPDEDKIAVVAKHTVSTDSRDVTVKGLRVLGSGQVNGEFNVCQR